jgi:hypothetical protein
MPRKPANWPRYMQAAKLKGGAVAYYWNKPSWARECSLPREALGQDYAVAIDKARVCNDVFDAWRRRARGLEDVDGPERPSARIGTVDWLIWVFQSSEKYKKCDPGTRANYDAGLALIANFLRKSGRRFGETALTEIAPRHADQLHERLVAGGKTGSRPTTAGHAMRAMRRAWNVAARIHPGLVPPANPFAGVEIQSTGRITHAASLDELERFCARANAEGHPSIALAAMAAFYWLQREADILTRLAWSDLTPGVEVKIRHRKNRNRAKGEAERVRVLPLTARDSETGAAARLYPEIEAQIALTPRRGALMVMRDKPDARRNGRPRAGQTPVHLPYAKRYFLGLVAEIREAAGLPAHVTFASFRHGGLTEGGDASATDSELQGASAHSSRQTLAVYTKATARQAAKLGLKRLAHRAGLRTNRNDLSE